MTEYETVALVIAAAYLSTAIVVFRRLLWPSLVKWVKGPTVYDEPFALTFGGAGAALLSLACPLLLAAHAVERLLDGPKDKREKEIARARLDAQHYAALAGLESDRMIADSYRQQAEAARHTAARLEAGV